MACPPLEMGIAINTGQVVVGNIGSDRRAKYSVVGSHVNFASRIKAYALGGQVIISAGTYERIKDVVDTGNVFEVEVKGMPEPVTLYEVLGLGGEYNLHLTGSKENLVRLPEPLPVSLYRLKDKIVTGAALGALVTELSATAARVIYKGELKTWDDVNLRFLSPDEEERPERLYGKVIAIKAATPGRQEATIRFTSLSADAEAAIRSITPKRV